MIELHVSSRVDDALRDLEIPRRVEARTLEDYIILRKLRQVNIDVVYSPHTELEKQILRYLELKDEKRSSDEYRKLKNLIRSEANTVLKLMLRELDWKRAYKTIIDMANIYIRDLSYLWILSQYHIHSLSRAVMNRIVERTLSNYEKILLLSIILFSIANLEIIDRKFISIKVHDVFYYFKWLLLLINNIPVVIFRSCDRIYTLSPVYVVSDQARMTIDSEYRIDRVDEHVMIIHARGYRTLICLTTHRDNLSLRLSYDKIVIKCEDSDFEDSKGSMKIIVPPDSSCIVKGSFEIDELDHLC
ncbi:MAG: hypothetical protein GXO23_03630 [Crenarchaeota archaeon]|nr:hypothetical protein [Thermoproteota archaeon]